MSEALISSTDADIAAISTNKAVPTILQVVTEMTGLRFACISRVTDTAWTACAVIDHINFGLTPGDELEVGMTFCKQVRDTGRPLVIDEVSADALYRDNLMPRLYGFESFIAMPVYRPDGSHFGSLCALDPLPARLSDPKTLAIMGMFSQLITHQLELSAGGTPTLDNGPATVLGRAMRGALDIVRQANAASDELLNQALPAPAVAAAQRLRRANQDLLDVLAGVLELAGPEPRR